MVEVVAQRSFASDLARVRQAVFAQEAFHLLSRRLARVNKRNIFPDGPLDRVAQDGVMGASEHECVGGELAHSFKVLFCDRRGFRLVRPSLLGERYEEWTADLQHLRTRRSTANRIEISIAG